MPSMAQPSESSPSRPPPPQQHHLASSPVELHAPHPPSEQQQQKQQQQQQQQDCQARQRQDDDDDDDDDDYGNGNGHSYDDQHGHGHGHHANAKDQHSPLPLAPETPPPPTTTTRRSSPSSYRDGGTHPVGNGNGNATHLALRGNEEGASCSGPATDARPDDRAPPVAGTADPTGHARVGVREARYSGDAPLSTSPSMSHPQPPQGPSRQPASYPSPTSYPPPGSIHPSYAYSQQPPPPPPQDPYRQAPPALPSMRTLDHVAPQPHQHQQHQHQQHPHHQHPHHQPQQHGMPMNAHMVGPMAPAPQMAYYGVPPHTYGIHHDPNAMRFAIPPGMADPRIALSGGRHKKEIKRRTKTGCLTCRKRRIKCDEAHPTCNNCKKSKRDCLGYDPIFKQSHQGPTAIQPAPNSQSPAPPSTVASTPTLPSTSHNYQPPVVPSSYPPSGPSSITFDSPVSSTAQSIKTEPGFDYSAAIDPALQGADLSTGAGTPPSPYQQARAGGTDEGASVEQQRKAKQMKIDELIALGGVTPPKPSSPPSATLLDEIPKLYDEVYSRGLMLFFESRWYELNEGRTRPTTILHNPQLVTLFNSFLQHIAALKGTGTSDLKVPSHLEACLIWALACLPGSCASPDQPRWPSLHGADGMETWHRVYVFEILLSGDTLATNPLPPPSIGDNNTTRKAEQAFWHYLGQYLLAAHSSSSPQDVATRERLLTLLRSTLDARENRDVLYSIAILREYTAHWDAVENEQTVPPHLEESDPRSKLAVATKFIRAEMAATGGTTNVVRRFAELAYRSFVRPGVNAHSPGSTK